MDTEFSERLREALEKKGWTQGQLARRLGITQPAVSQMLAGKRDPSAKLKTTIAKQLDVEPAWLISGAGEAPEAALTDSPDDLSWHEREVYPDGSRSFGNAKAEALETTLPILVREAAQNSNDAAIHGEVSMEFRLGVLSGATLERFLGAIHWPTLLPHFESVAADHKHRSTKRYRQGLELLKTAKRLSVLRIDDHGTTGLIGDDFADGNFAALVRRSQDTQKAAGPGSGGRFGLGAGILSACSAFDLLLFTSNLSEQIRGKNQGRFIGRAIFPFHQIGNDEYEGPFFFGVRDPNDAVDVRRRSAWVSEQQLRQLWLDRDEDSGTSILIVGFFDPEQGIDEQADFGETLTNLSRAFSEFFWPAIARGRLSARFTRYDNDKLVQDITVDPSNLEHPYAELLNDGERVREREIVLHVPESRDTGDGPHDHTARLLVDVLPAEAIGAQRVNEVALCRKPLMVVKYMPLPHLTLGAKNFRAILLAGEAAVGEGVTTPADVAAENFLAKAEPAQHDDWTSKGTDLVAEYRGGWKALSDFLGKLRSEIKDLVTPEHDRSQDAPRALRELLSLPGTTPAPKLKAYVSDPKWRDPGTFEELLAVVRLAVRANDDAAFRPMLSVATESGGSLPLPISIVDCKGADVSSDGTLRPHRGVREFQLVIKPQWDHVPVRPALSAVNLDMSIQEKGRA